MYTYRSVYYDLFQNLKFHLGGVRYPEHKSLKASVEVWRDVINSLAEEKCHKCIELCFDYVEKKTVVRITAITFSSQVAKRFERRSQDIFLSAAERIEPRQYKVIRWSVR